MRVLIVGLGIGKVYQEEAAKRNYETITVDSNPLLKPNFIGLVDLFKKYKEFDISIICTPNHTHQHYIEKLATCSKVVIVEKPGLANANDWKANLEKYENTRIVMSKNNMFRNTINQWIDLAKDSKTVNVLWINKNRVPNPGGWFTNKDLAWGGVSYDLMPHLLSIGISIFGKLNTPFLRKSHQIWDLQSVSSTEYGKINTKNPVYNVDDHCRIEFMIGDKKLNCVSVWKTDKIKEDLIEIQFIKDTGVERFQLGLCPNYAYGEQMDFYYHMKESDYKIQQYFDLFILNSIHNIRKIRDTDYFKDIVL